MGELMFKGKVWKFGNNVDTDQITPSQYMDLPVEEMSRHALEPISSKFAADFKAGDIVVGGSNFGCGSSRETAPDVLKFLGTAVVVAESFGRIFFRNAIAIGLPVMVCPGISGIIDDGDEIEVDIEGACVTNLKTGKSLQGEFLNDMMIASLKKGGIMKLLAET